MESDPLQQLRDVHLPPDPTWWPPAIGWWVVALLVVAAVVWLIVKAVRAYQRRAPLRQASTLLHELLAAHQHGELSAIEFLHQGNELLKRVLVRAYGYQEYAPMAGQTWLRALDDISGTDHFSNGHGKVLGEARFSAQPEVDVPALFQELKLLLSKVPVSPPHPGLPIQKVRS